MHPQHNKTQKYGGACLSSRASLRAHLLVPLVGTVVRYAVQGVEVFLPRRVGLPEDAPRAVVEIIFVERHSWDRLRIPRGSSIETKSAVDAKIQQSGITRHFYVENVIDQNTLEIRRL